MPRRASEVTRRLKRRDNYRLCGNGSLGGARGLDINSECCERLSAPRTRPVPLRRRPARSARHTRAQPPVSGTRGHSTANPLGCALDQPQEKGRGCPKYSLASALCPELCAGGNLRRGRKGTGQTWRVFSARG